MLDLTENERLAIAVELRCITDDDRYPFSFHVRTLKGILDELVLQPPREPLPPPKVHAPPRATAANRRREGEIQDGAAHDGISHLPGSDMSC